MKALAKKMVAVMKAVDAVEKSGKNEKQGYKYVKATDVAREVRNALIQNGIAFGYSIEKTERWTQPTISGGSLNFIEMWGNVTFADMDSDETATYQAVGWGMDSGDKAPYKAMTGLLKYALRMNFMIPDELDPENDSADSHATNGSGKEIVRKSQKPAPGPFSPHSDERSEWAETPIKAQVGITANGDPIFDEDGQPVVVRPGPTQLTQQLQASINKMQQAPTTNGGSFRQISEKQAKRFFAVAMSAGHTKLEINNYLGTLGCERSEEIQPNQYDSAMTWAATR
jgi:hypothetical protein